MRTCAGTHEGGEAGPANSGRSSSYGGCVRASSFAAVRGVAGGEAQRLSDFPARLRWITVLRPCFLRPGKHPPRCPPSVAPTGGGSRPLTPIGPGGARRGWQSCPAPARLGGCGHTGSTATCPQPSPYAFCLAITGPLLSLPVYVSSLPSTTLVSVPPCYPPFVSPTQFKQSELVR